MMKKIFLLSLLCFVLLSACSTNKASGDNQVNVSDSTAEFGIPEIQNDNIVSPTDTNLPEEERQSIPEGKDLEYDEIDYETLGIQKQEYPAVFSMGENLKTAITQLALSYDHFGKDSVSSESWKEIFIARFIQNSRASFDYLDRISDENDGKISVDQLNYIQYSLTNTEVDFSSETGDSLNRYDAASSLNYGWISGYSYEETKDGVIVTADFEVGYDGTDSTQKRQITVELIKNPYSCFDGYSVITISSETGNSDPEHQN